MNDNLVKIKKLIENKIGERIDTRNRRRDLTYARAIYCKLARENNFPYARIGSVINRDHVSVMHNIKNIFPHAISVPEIEEMYLGIKASVNAPMKKKKLVRAGVDKSFNAFLELNKENKELKEQIDTLNYKYRKIASLFEGLSDSEVEELYDRAKLIVKSFEWQRNQK